VKTFLLLALVQAPRATTPAAPAEAVAPAVEPWTKCLDEGLAETQRLFESGQSAGALALTERLLAPTRSALWREEATAQPGWKRTVVETAGPILDVFGLASLTDLERATIQHARGVVLAQSTDGKRLAAVEAFDRARSLAGPGDLRLDATYDAAWTWLATGEELRAKIPEISGAIPPAAAAAAPGAPGATPGAPAAAPPEPDPLALAKTAYLQARGRFVERIQLEASDADTRANLELVQRRLRELAEIEKKREDEKKEQEEQRKKDEQDQQKDPKKDDQQKDDEKKDDLKKDSDPKPDEKPKPDEEKPDEKPPKDSEQDPKDTEKSKDPKKDRNQKPAKEELLTREEVMRLLDILKNREDEGKKLQEQLRAARRVPVKKDW